MPPAIRPSADGVLVDVLVRPNARRAEVVGPHGDRIKIAVTAAPQRLQANAAVIDLLCSVCGVRTADIVAGRTTRYKTVELVGADVASVTRALSGQRQARRP